MRVLVITNYFPPRYVGGAEVSAYNTCLGLRERGIDVSVLVVNNRRPERSDLWYRAPVSGVPQSDSGGPSIPVHQVTYLSPGANHALLQVFDPRAYRAVKAELERFQPDLVHVHNVSGTTLAPFVACRQENVPVALTLHDHWLLCPNNMLYKSDGSLCDPALHSPSCGRCFRRYDFWANVPWRRRALACLVQGVDVFVSPSRKLVDLHVAAGYDRRRFRVVPYGIYSAVSRNSSDPLLREYFRESRQFNTLLFAGAVVETKGVQTIVKALPHLSRYVERLRLFIAGQGDPSLLSALRRFGPTTVKLLGLLPFEEMRSLYAAADLTIVPSVWYDNSPMVIYESLLAGTPVLGSDIGGIPELIQPEQTGYLCAPGDALELTEKVIQHFACSAWERRAMRGRCADYARTHLSMDVHLDRLQEVYAETLAGVGRSAARHRAGRA